LVKSTELLYLSRCDVEKLNVSVREVTQVVEDAFLEKAAGRVEVPPKPGIHPTENAFIHAMPALIPRMEAAGVKWVSGFPGNPQRQLPYITGLLILNDMETGFPVCVMDCTWITAKRTGAATAIAAKHLAIEKPELIGIMGCGVQGRSNLEALVAVFPSIEEVRAYDVNAKNLQKYVRDTKAAYDLRVIPVGSPKKAVEHCDIVVTAGPILKHPQPVIESAWFKDGGFACPLDFDSYWKPEAIHSMDKLYTDDKEQFGYYRKLGYFSSIPNVSTDLSEVLSGEKSGRENPNERIMSIHLGLAIEDMATAVLVHDRARRIGVGTIMPL
jgi:ornithine cyclodeaminase/alanine dehydrogenase